MSYSIKPIIKPRPLANGKHKVLIEVIYERKKSYPDTKIIIEPKYWRVETNDKGVEMFRGVKGHPNSASFNRIIMEAKNLAERRLLDSIAEKEKITDLSKVVKEKKEDRSTILAYIHDFIKENPNDLSAARLEQYQVLIKKLQQFFEFYKVAENRKGKFIPGNRMIDINDTWMLTFQRWLQSHKNPKKEATEELAPNTVWSKIGLMLAVINTAVSDKLLKENPLSKYEKPSYIQTIPDYLTLEEREKFMEVTQMTQQHGMKRAGYYFLLSCYAGYRMSDLQTFNYNERVKDGKIVVRAAKNGKIVSIPVYNQLGKILDYIKDHPLNLSEQRMRDYVKEIARFAGLGRKIKVHTARHTFAMMLMDDGFKEEEVAELLGDTREVARIYARVSNSALSKKIMEKYGASSILKAV